MFLLGINFWVLMRVLRVQSKRYCEGINILENCFSVLEKKERFHSGHSSLPVFLPVCPHHWLDRQLVVCDPIFWVRHEDSQTGDVREDLPQYNRLYRGPHTDGDDNLSHNEDNIIDFNLIGKGYFNVQLKNTAPWDGNDNLILQCPETLPSNQTRRGRKPLRLDMKSKLEKSRQSARECRARKKLRYQYLEELV